MIHTIYIEYLIFISFVNLDDQIYQQQWINYYSPGRLRYYQQNVSYIDLTL
jgi:hypothetical protein